MQYQITAIAVLVLMSGYFSASETAFSTLNKTRLKTLIDKGNKRAQLALDLAEDYDRMISAILIGNNIVNIALSTIATILFVHLCGEASGATVATIVSTIIVLFLGEITPKSLAKQFPERFAIFSAPILRVIIAVFMPMNWIFAQWKKLVGKVVHDSDDHRMTQDELLMLVEEVEQEGSIGEDESNLLRSVIEFTDLDAEDILTHRVDLEALPVDSTKEEIAACFTETRYSRLLLYEENIDNVVGVLHQKDFYSGTTITERPVRELMSTPVFIPKSVKISDLLKNLQKAKSHMAVVLDEYGGTLGIVTMEDILEELVGDIWDEHDDVEVSYQKIDDNSYLVDADETTADLFQLFDLDIETESPTIGGWVLDEMERIPESGDSFDFEGMHVEITSVEDHRVLQVKVTYIPPEEENE